MYRLGIKNELDTIQLIFLILASNLSPLTSHLSPFTFQFSVFTSILQAMSLRIEDALRSADNELTINEVLINRFTVIHPFTDILE